MSKEGLNLAADVFKLMQETRYKLLKMGTKPEKLPDYQDILLGQMLEDGKDAMKHKFEELTMIDSDGRKRKK